MFVQPVADNIAAEWPVAEFRKHGVTYQLSDKNRSELYLGMIPVVNSKRCELPDDRRMIDELRHLERCRGRSGKDSIDHPLRWKRGYSEQRGRSDQLDHDQDADQQVCDSHWRRQRHRLRDSPGVRLYSQSTAVGFNVRSCRRGTARDGTRRTLPIRFW